MEKKAKKRKSKLVHWLSRIGTTFGLAGLSWLYLSLTGLTGGSFFAGLLCALTSYEFGKRTSPKISIAPRILLTAVAFFAPYFFHLILQSPEFPYTTIFVYEIFLALFIVVTLSALRFGPVLQLVSRSRLFPIWGITLPLSAFIFIAHFFIDQGRTSTQALLWVITLIFITKATDIGALLFGSAFGKHKLAPKTSPGKTIEGAIGGVLLSITVALVIFWLASIQLDSTGTISTFQQVLKVIVAVSIISTAGILGDLFESSWKRHVELKDSGRILPGLGGAYDLTDSLILTAPFGYFIVRYFLIS